jgi:hypothetical protein
MQQPRLPEKLVGELGRWLSEKGITSLAELRGSLKWEN